jgi:hypothetical protein
MSHTPGKLAVSASLFDNEGCPETVIVGVEKNAFVAVAIDFGENNPGMRDANARRLVACWNALIDLPQDALDGGWTRAGLEAYGLQMKAQRDELLAALKESRRWIGDGDLSDGMSRETWTPKYTVAVALIDKAIATAEGTTP